MSSSAVSGSATSSVASYVPLHHLITFRGLHIDPDCIGVQQV